jgi:zinc D-Ala-D-Ala carboxypeptidase
MTSTEPPRTSSRRIPTTLAAGFLAVIVVVIAAQAYRSPESAFAPSKGTSASPTSAFRSSAPASSSSKPPSSSSIAGSPTKVPPRERRSPLGEADGVIPDGTTVFDDGVPGVAKLDRGLLAALRRAATAASHEGVEFYVNSGWRSPAYEEQLLREATSKYGSEREAARWVATPDRSAHVSGDAVDIGPSEATAWLSRHGSRYGLCQIYRNEPWHYELRPKAVDHGCPPMYADAAHDPRIQQ